VSEGASATTPHYEVISPFCYLWMLYSARLGMRQWESPHTNPKRKQGQGQWLRSLLALRVSVGAGRAKYISRIRSVRGSTEKFPCPLPRDNPPPFNLVSGAMRPSKAVRARCLSWKPRATSPRIGFAAKSRESNGS